MFSEGHSRIGTSRGFPGGLQWHLPPMWETRVRSLGREDPLEKEMVTHSSILAWRIPWTEEPGGLQSTGLQRVGHDWATSLSCSFHCTMLSVRLPGCLPTLKSPICLLWGKCHCKKWQTLQVFPTHLEYCEVEEEARCLQLSYETEWLLEEKT